MRMLKLGTLLIALAVGTRGAGAQELKQAPDIRGEWEYAAGTYDYKYYGATAAEKAAHQATLKRFLDAVRAAPVMNPPIGFQVAAHMGPYTAMDARDECDPRPCVARRLEAILMFQFCPFYTDLKKPQAKPIIHRVEVPELNIWLNRQEETVTTALDYMGRTSLVDAQGVTIFFQPEKKGEVAGFPVYDGERIIFTASSKPLWLPVTCEHFLQAKIHETELILADSKKSLSDAAGPYREWMKGKAQRKAEREKVYLEMKKTDPKAAADEVRGEEEAEAALEKGLREQSEQLAANEGSHPFKAIEDQLADMHAELAALSPADRKLQAWYPGKEYERGGHASRLAPPGYEFARPLAMFNPDLFDRSLPRTAVQLVVVRFGGNMAAAFGDTASRLEDDLARLRMYQMLQTTDWQSFSKLLYAGKN